MNNDIDLSVSSMNNDINSRVNSINNIDSSVNSTNNVSTASEIKIVDIDITKDQSSSGYVSKSIWFRILDLEIRFNSC